MAPRLSDPSTITSQTIASYGQSGRPQDGGVLARHEYLDQRHYPHGGRRYRQLIVDLYRNNLLMKNEMIVFGEKVDLRRLRANLLTVIAKGDSHHPALPIGSID